MNRVTNKIRPALCVAPYWRLHSLKNIPFLVIVLTSLFYCPNTIAYEQQLSAIVSVASPATWSGVTCKCQLTVWKLLVDPVVVNGWLQLPLRSMAVYGQTSAYVSGTVMAHCDSGFRSTTAGSWCCRDVFPSCRSRPTGSLIKPQMYRGDREGTVLAAITM